jgi:hypothetical protein
LTFVKDSKTVDLLEKIHQHDAEEEKKNKILGFSKKKSASWTRLSEPGQSYDTHII